MVSLFFSSVRANEFHQALLEKGGQNFVSKLNLFSKDGLQGLVSALNEKNSSGETVLIHAIKRNNIDAVKAILQLAEASSIIDRRSDNENTALHEAVLGDYVAIVKAILASSVAPKIIYQTNNTKETALIFAVKLERETIVDAFVESEDIGLTINDCDSSGNTALMWAVFKSYRQPTIAIAMFKKLLTKCEKKCIDHQNERKWTALMYAVSLGQYEIAELLCDKKANINLANDKYETALMMAVDKGHIAIAQLLLDQGADASLKNRWGDTAFMYAIRKGNLDLVTLFLNKTKPNFEDKNYFNDTPLERATRFLSHLQWNEKADKKEIVARQEIVRVIRVAMNLDPAQEKRVAPEQETTLEPIEIVIKILQSLKIKLSQLLFQVQKIMS